MDGDLDVRRVGERLVPGRGGLRPAFPRRERDGLDRLHRDAALRAHLRERLELLGVALILQLADVVRQEHGVEREALEAAPVHRGDREAVAGDADEADEALLARLDGGLERAVRRQRDLPVDHVDEVVELDQVDVVDAEPVERPPDLLLRARVVPLAGLGGDEEPARLALEPRGEAQLGVAVRGGRVDVVDAVLEQELERALGLGVGDRSERRGAEDRAAALVSGAAERRPCDHGTNPNGWGASWSVPRESAATSSARRTCDWPRSPLTQSV